MEERSDLTGRRESMEIYNLATKEPCFFLYINLTALKLNDSCYITFNQQLNIEE